MVLCLSPFLKTGQTLACFQSVGMMPVDSDFLKDKLHGWCYIGTDFFKYFAADLIWACSLMWIDVIK